MTSEQHVSGGELLVSTHPVGAGFFDQSVILLLESDTDGAVGIALNKPSQMPVSQVLPDWEAQLNPPQVLFAGGPVLPNGALCLAKVLDPGEDPLGWRRITGDIGVLHLDTPVELAVGAFSDVRVFAGYSGWEAGQLEREIRQGAWLRTTPREEEIFGADTDDLWRRVLRRMGSQAALLSAYTANPELN
ncbi:YqgE/AlgH family protein [Propionibacterium australiense]|uniref:YqgE/AlgH family protein n=1 Tax=Propionibacterium australiense TaxID=119981 RepID=UPI001E3B4D37|nr:YqgE/AlgH family protein [Propionibacterium australiense]